MDGTLVDTEPYWIETEFEVIERYGGTWSTEHALNLIGNDLLESGRYIREHSGIDLEPADIVEQLLDGVVARVEKRVPWRPGALELLSELRANQVVSGLALTLFGQGLSAYLGTSLVGRAAPDSFNKLAIPLVSDIPRIGTILFRQDALVYLAYIVVPALWWWVYRTRPGLHLRSVGENPATADAMGLDVNRIRYQYVVVGGAFAGLGGAVISLATNPGWTENMTAGRGWIAVALVIFGTWNPARAAAGALLFGAVEAAQFRMQTINVPISSFFLNMTPYIFTILVLILATRQTRRMRIGQPAALGVPYVREER